MSGALLAFALAGCLLASGATAQEQPGGGSQGVPFQGRFFWGGLSDTIGRSKTFSIMLGSQVLAFAALAHTGNPWIFAGLFCYVLLCYGGGFGTMPSFVLDCFGARLMPVVYGTILTAWSAAGIVGPQTVGLIKDRWPTEAGHYSFLASTAFVVAGFLVTFLLSDTASEKNPA